MEPREHDRIATKRRVWLLSLFAAHVLIGVALVAILPGGYYSEQSLPGMSFVGLVFAQGRGARVVSERGNTDGP